MHLPLGRRLRAEHVQETPPHLRSTRSRGARNGHAQPRAWATPCLRDPVRLHRHGLAPSQAGWCGHAQKGAGPHVGVGNRGQVSVPSKGSARGAHPGTCTDISPELGAPGPAEPAGTIPSGPQHPGVCDSRVACPGESHTWNRAACGFSRCVCRIVRAGSGTLLTSCAPGPPWGGAGLFYRPRRLGAWMLGSCGHVR